MLLAREPRSTCLHCLFCCEPMCSVPLFRLDRVNITPLAVASATHQQRTRYKHAAAVAAAPGKLCGPRQECCETQEERRPVWWSSTCYRQADEAAHLFAGAGASRGWAAGAACSTGAWAAAVLGWAAQLARLPFPSRSTVAASLPARSSRLPGTANSKASRALLNSMQACSTVTGLQAPAQGARKPARCATRRAGLAPFPAAACCSLLCPQLFLLHFNRSRMHPPPGRLARGSMAARPARRPAAPVAALDPSAVDALYQVQEFGLTIMGVGIVSTFAAGMAHSLRRATATYTATAATVAAEAPAATPAAAAAPAPAAALEQQPAAAAVEQRAPVTTPAVPVLELSDLKSELQQAAAAAVAAVKSAAAAEPAPPAKPAPAAAPAPTASGAVVKPGLTVEEATQVRTRGMLGRLGLVAGCAMRETPQPLR